MKKSLEERIKSKLLNMGRKNQVLRVLAIMVLFLVMPVFSFVKYLQKNTKRLAMMTMCCFLFSVFGSFSFPAFIMGKDANSYSLNVEGAQNVSLVQETELNLEEFQLLEYEEVLGNVAYKELIDPDDILDEFDVNVDPEVFEPPMEAASVGESVDLQGEAAELPEAGISEAEASAEQAEKSYGEKSEEPVFAADDWRLRLVNKQNFVPEDFEIKLGTIKTFMGTLKCDERITKDLKLMFQAAEKDGVTLGVRSAYRDFAYQETLFNYKIKRYMGMGMSYMQAYQVSSQVVTVPGASEHQIGLALDIVSNEYTALEEGFGKTAAGKWLAEHSAEYGFILRYPKGKEYITGIIYEPWHFRYVGRDAATLITEQGITLEEFWEEYL